MSMLPCPFCGRIPRGVFGPHEVLGSYWVECEAVTIIDNHESRVELCGEWHYLPNSIDDDEARKETAAAWNCRK